MLFLSQTQKPTTFIDIDGIYVNFHGDPLTIYDGTTQIAELTGDLGKFDISSTGNSLIVKFKSDNMVSKAGFFATIQYGNSYLNIK